MERFPDEIKKFLEGMRLVKITIGRSGDMVYEATGLNNYIVKTSKNIRRLEREKTIFEWLDTYNLLPVPKVLFWMKTNRTAYLIESRLPGRLACDAIVLQNPNRLINVLVKACEMVSKVELDNYPYPSELKSDKLHFSHGDLCLPNLIVRGTKIVGFVDMGDAGVDEYEKDVATCLRSLEYNLNSKDYSEIFLKKIKNCDTKRVMEYYPIVFD